MFSFLILLTAYIIVTNITRNTLKVLISTLAQGKRNPASSTVTTFTLRAERTNDRRILIHKRPYAVKRALKAHHIIRQPHRMQHGNPPIDIPSQGHAK